MSEATEKGLTGFDDWFDTYERDGGELMLFNAIDLEAAFNAGNKVSVREEECMECERLAYFEIRDQAAREAVEVAKRHYTEDKRTSLIAELMGHFGLEATP